MEILPTLLTLRAKRIPNRMQLRFFAAALLILCGCTTTPRLNIRFDSDALGPPSTTPLPTPPNDGLSYTQTQQLTSTVVSDPAGGNWLSITPTPAFITSPDSRKRAIIVSSEPFTTNPPAQIRGHLRLSLKGNGVVTVGLRPFQSSGSPDFIGGFNLGNGQVFLLNEFSLNQIENAFLTSPAGKWVANISPGAVIDINWSIDQGSRSLSASVSGGPSQSTTFSATSGGSATTPIQQLGLWVWLEKPSNSTAVFVDNLFAEEYQ